jgi:hypothetical protein
LSSAVLWLISEQSSFEVQRVLEYIRDPDNPNTKFPHGVTPALIHARLDNVKRKMDSDAAAAVAADLEPSYRSRDEIKAYVTVINSQCLLY